MPGTRGHLLGAWERVKEVVGALPARAASDANGRSIGEEFEMAACLPFWSLEACVLGFEPCSGVEVREQRRWFLLWRMGARYFSDGVFSTVQR